MLVRWGKRALEFVIEKITWWSVTQIITTSGKVTELAIIGNGFRSISKGDPSPPKSDQ